MISIVGYPADVEAIYLQAGGIVERANPGAVLIDMTTSSPALAERIAEAAAARGLTALDAPVSGGDVGAREARLAIMVGGDAAIFAKVKPVLELMGRNIALMGGAGAGQHTKMANQIAIAWTMLGGRGKPRPTRARPGSTGGPGAVGDRDRRRLELPAQRSWAARWCERISRRASSSIISSRT